jgi:hypothetical protein
MSSCDDRDAPAGDWTEEERGRSPMGNKLAGGRGPAKDLRGEDSEYERDIETRTPTPIAGVGTNLSPGT